MLAGGLYQIVVFGPKLAMTFERLERSSSSAKKKGATMNVKTISGRDKHSHRIDIIEMRRFNHRD